MKNYIWVLPGGGPFSRFLQCGIIPMADLEFDNAFLTLSPFEENTSNDEYLQEAVDHIRRNREYMQMYGIDRPYDHIMGYVLDQTTDRSYEYQGFLPVGKMYDRNDPIEHSSRLEDYRRVLAKLHIKNEIKTRVDDLCRLVAINEKTLGVHVRLTTMSVHTNYIPVTIEDYFAEIDQVLESGDYDNLYVATDNVESLVKMENRYASVIRYYPNLLRLPTETIQNVSEWSWEYDMFFRRQFWQESFMEAMTLARCGGMICRDSNFSNAAIVFSQSLKHIIRVNHAA
jgi:hypothetical protein